MGVKMRIRSKRGHKVVDLNRRRAIRERCMNCSAWVAPDVVNCEMRDCQLFNYRMGTEKQDAKARAKAILGYCSWCSPENELEKSKCVSFDCPLWAYRKSSVDKSLECADLT